MALLRDYFAPGAVESAYQEVARSLQIGPGPERRVDFSRAAIFCAEKAGRGMQMEAASLEVLASALCLQDSSLSRSEESLGVAR